MYLFCITLTFISLLSSGLAANCYGPASKLAVSEFDAFPSPVPPGKTLFIRAKVDPKYNISSAKVRLSVFHTDQSDVSDVKPLIDIAGLDFCKLSTSITCPLTAGTHIFQWEYYVPDLLPGTYQVRYTIVEDSPLDGNAYSCIQFPVTVQGDQTDQFTSWYQATLLGTARFTHDDDYKARTIGENLQVGPIGTISNGSVDPFAYGIIKYLSGSGDLVPNNYYDTSNFVWGLSGSMIKRDAGTKAISHIYQGTCYLGYINPFYPNAVGYTYTYATPLIECTFLLNWTYTDSNVAQITGSAEFSPDATIPYGWGFPLLFGRLGEHQVVTSDIGFLQIQGNLPFCPSGVCASPPSQGGSGGLSSDKLGLAIGLPIAVVFILLVAFAAFVYYKKKTVTEQEDGVFAVSRKPEYGSALVVDGIIEETMGSKTMQAMLDMRDEDVGSGEESEEESERAHSRTRSRSRTASRSRSRSAERAGSESDPGESASRGSDDD